MTKRALGWAAAITPAVAMIPSNVETSFYRCDPPLFLGVHHIALRTSDLLRSKCFYEVTLGFPLILEKENLFIFLAGATAVGVRGPEAPTPEGDVFSPFRVGLDHLALACTEEAELERVAVALSAAGVQNTGVKLDPTLNKKYVAFKDPDGIAWELYLQ